MHDNMMNRPDNHEAKMARADLFKLAQYSFKLFKMINEQQELEGWVQAKITKAADYIASVYHYMEYEMKISEYGDAVENADMYSESIRRAFEQKLTEAKEMASKAKAEVKKKEKELEETTMPVPMDGATAPPPKGPDGKYPVVVSGPHKGKRWSPQTPGPTNPAFAKKVKEDMKVGDTKKTRTGELTKTSTGVVHKRTDYSDDEHGEAPSTVKQKSAAEKKADKENDIKLPKHKGNTWGMKGGEKFGKKMEEAAKPDFLDMDKDGDKKEPMKKAVADKKKGSVKKADEALDMNLLKSAQGAMSKNKKDKESDDNVRKPYGYRGASGSENDDKDDKKKSKAVKEESKCNHTPKGEKCPIHGLKECGGMYEGSTGDYSAKKAAAGKDIGKPGKNFAKIAKSAGKAYGSKERGEKVAGAVLAKLRAKG